VEASAATRIDYSQFHIVDGSTLPEPSSMPANGLVATQPGTAVIFTSASSGWVHVTVDARTAGPQDVDTASWDEVVETDIEATTGRVTVQALMDAAPSLPILTTSGPGTYRLRIHARGRDLHPDVVAFEPVEEYLIQAWPASPSPDHVYKQTDAWGASLRVSAEREKAAAHESRPVKAARVPPPKQKRRP
jgi:hypothetical protein